METLFHGFEAFKSFVVFLILKNFFFCKSYDYLTCNMNHYWPILANMLNPTVDIAPVDWDSRVIYGHVLHNSLKLIITIVTPIFGK